MKVMAEYWPRGRGNKMVVGAQTKVKYGVHSKGDVFAVEVDDIYAQPSIWLCPETNEPFKFERGEIKCPEWEGRSRGEIVVDEVGGIDVSVDSGWVDRETRLRRAVEERERLLASMGIVAEESHMRMEAGVTAAEYFQAQEDGETIDITKPAEPEAKLEDLTVVDGVGRSTMKTLYENGITTIDTFSKVGNPFLQKMGIHPRIIGKIRAFFDKPDWREQLGIVEEDNE